MKNKFTMALTLAVILAMLMTAVALADNVYNTLDNSIDNQKETATMTAGGSIQIGFKIEATSSPNGDIAECNVDANNKATLTITPPSGVTVSGQVQFDACNQEKKVTFSSNTPNSYQFNQGAFSLSGGKTGSLWNTNTAQFTLNVTQPVDTTAPVWTVPADFSVEATGPSGANVNYTASAIDSDDAVSSQSCTPASGSLFALGTTAVNCTATDTHSNTGTASFNVHVVDTTAPAIAENLPMMAEATSPSGAMVAFSNPTASDTVDTSVDVVCVLASGSTFALGTNTVTCTATDDSGNHSSSTFTVTVQDKTAPVIAPHGDETAEATSALGAIVSYAAPATSDIVDGAGTATCTPASGAQFTLGDTTVTCNATDAHSNAATPTTFKVTVQDKTAPVIAAHADVTEEATSALGAIVDYTAPATSDAVDGAGTATCAPASGTQFGFGNTTVKCDAVDAAGNHATQTSFVVHVVDTTAPVIAFHLDVTEEATSALGATVNYTSPATSDAVDGAKTATCAPASGSQFALGNTTVKCDAVDAAGNHATQTSFLVHVVDTTPPTITFDSRTPANGNGWNNGDVTVNWNCTDLVGVVSASVSETVSTEGTNQSATGTCEDTSGNKASNTQNDINIDKTNPTASASRTPDANSLGWNKTDVTVSFSGTDDRSGIASCSADVVRGEGAGQSASGTCTDMAGNVSDAATISNINVDKTAPSASASRAPDANANGWNNSAVTVSFSGSDDLSGLASCDADVVLNSEGAGQSAAGYCYDNAGNTSGKAEVTGINIDLTAPIISAALDKTAVSGWFNISTGAPTVNFTCNDALSGLDGSCPDSHLFGDGAGQSYSQSVSDLAGNSASAGVTGVNVDTVAPSINSSISPARPASGWWNIASGAPTVTYTCSDGTSGVASCTSPFTFGEGENQAHSGSAFDVAGNSASIGVNDIDVDLTAPTSIAFVGGPTAGGNYYFGSVPAEPTCTADGAISGLVSCNVSGYATTVGTHSMTATATDKAGNVGTATRSYTVLKWTISGFYQPVDMGKLNTSKNGSTVPLKFEVFAGSTELTNINIISTFIQKESCINFLTDDIETYATGGTSLRYDTTGGQFIFNWQTPKVVGGCYKVTLTTQDGYSIFADFKLK